MAVGNQSGNNNQYSEGQQPSAGNQPAENLQAGQQGETGNLQAGQEGQAGNLGVGQEGQTGNIQAGQEGQTGNIGVGQQTLPVQDTPQLANEEYSCLDFNEDGIVNIQDVIYAVQNHGEVTAGMVQRFMSGGNPYDINQDGEVNSQDIILAVANNCPQTIIDKMTEIVLAPPPLSVEEQSLEFNASPIDRANTHHPLDLKMIPQQWHNLVELLGQLVELMDFMYRLLINPLQ